MSCSESDMISKTWPVSFLQLTDLSISLVTKDIAVRVVGRSLAFLGRSLTAKLLIHVHGGQIVKLTKEQQLRWDITIDVMRSIETQFLAVSVKAGTQEQEATKVRWKRLGSPRLVSLPLPSSAHSYICGQTRGLRGPFDLEPLAGSP